MRSRNHHSRKPCERQEGAALIVAVITLLMVAMIGIHALGHSREESTAGARARSTDRAFQAADAGVQFAIARLAHTPPNLSAFSVNVDGTTVESRTRDDASAQNLEQMNVTAPPDGFSINVGSDSSFSGRVFQVNVTSSSGNGAMAEVEARFSRFQSGGNSY